MHRTAHRLRMNFWSGASERDTGAAARALRAGRLVAFPTETVYGLGADATNDAAVRAIFAAKGRPADNPLIVHVASVDALRSCALTPLPLRPLAAALAEAFWPGPLTIVVPLADGSRLSPAVTAGLMSVGIRVPRHPVAFALLDAAGVPVAAPSANVSGRPSPTCAEHVVSDLDGRIHGVVDGGQTHGDSCGLESTVVDLTDESRPCVLRPGAVSVKDLERATGVAFKRPRGSSSRCQGAPLQGLSHQNGSAGHDRADGDDGDDGQIVDRPKAPGMKYRHYAPRAPVFLAHSESRTELELQRLCALYPPDACIGLLADSQQCERHAHNPRVRTVPCGETGDVASFARELYGALRAFDGEGPLAVAVPVHAIVATVPSDVEDGIGEAVLNRLMKAAAGQSEPALSSAG